MVCNAVRATIAAFALSASFTVQALQDPMGDQDNDGVVNQKDQCANTPSNAKVDGVGCPTKTNRQEHFEQALLFDKNSARPLQTEYVKLDKLAAYAISHPNSYVLVEGFKSTAETVDDIDSQRTTRIVQMMLEKGIKRSQIRIANSGDHTPMVEGDSPAAHSANQRVYVRITTTITDYEKRFISIM
jgi:OOP family OmpA-OmpF porin